MRPDTDDGSTEAPPHSGPPRWVAVAIVFLLLGSIGVWWAKREPDLLRLGDRGRVTAVVDPTCIDLQIHQGDLFVAFHQPITDDKAPLPLPTAWQGRRIRGQLHLDRRKGDVVFGTFTARDGTVVHVVGGGPGSHVFFTADCHGWPPYPHR